MLLSYFFINKGWRLTPNEILIALWCYLSAPEEGGWFFQQSAECASQRGRENSKFPGFLSLGTDLPILRAQPTVASHSPRPSAEIGGAADPTYMSSFSSPKVFCWQRTRDCWWPHFQAGGEAPDPLVLSFKSLTLSTPVVWGCGSQIIIFVSEVAWRGSCHRRLAQPGVKQ